MKFNDWWRQYPRKTAKHMAAKEWQRMTEDERQQALAVIPLQAKAWRGQDTKFIPHGRTYLHQKRYLDDEFEVQRTKTEKWMDALYGHGQGSDRAIRRTEPGIWDAEDAGGVAGRIAAGHNQGVAAAAMPIQPTDD